MCYRNYKLSIDTKDRDQHEYIYRDTVLYQFAFCGSHFAKNYVFRKTKNVIKLLGLIQLMMDPFFDFSEKETNVTG